jgi:hypothetical protein
VLRIDPPVPLAPVIAIVRSGDGVVAAMPELPPPTSRAAATAGEIAAQLVRLPVGGGGVLSRDGDAAVVFCSAHVAEPAHGDDRIAGGFKRR